MSLEDIKRIISNTTAIQIKSRTDESRPYKGHSINARVLVSHPLLSHELCLVLFLQTPALFAKANEELDHRDIDGRCVESIHLANLSYSKLPINILEISNTHY